mmetsp:Transcript_39253/g.37670  ORF Transcript_39253/g.37670 Transcript_39253/m.37670 type:complete len:89 (-) Transcript_39253:443-709(-)
MLFTAYWPLLEFGYLYGLLLFFRILDRRCSREPSTRAKTVQAYVDLYSGPEYYMHFKYSAILNVVYVTFMYGVALPILFPIALLFFVV